MWPRLMASLPTRDDVHGHERRARALRASRWCAISSCLRALSATRPLPFTFFCASSAMGRPRRFAMGPASSLAPKPSATCASSRPLAPKSTHTRAPRGPMTRAIATSRSSSSPPRRDGTGRRNAANVETYDAPDLITTNDVRQRSDRQEVRIAQALLERERRRSGARLGSRNEKLEKTFTQRARARRGASRLTPPFADGVRHARMIQDARTTVSMASFSGLRLAIERRHRRYDGRPGAGERRHVVEVNDRQR